MNWLLYITIGILAIGAIAGYISGAVRIAVSMAATVITLLLVAFLTPYAADAVIKYTPADEWIEEKCAGAVFDNLSGVWQETAEEMGLPEEVGLLDMQGGEALEKFKEIQIPRKLQSRLIENAEIPQVFKSFLENNNNKEVYSMIGADSFADYIAKGISRQIISIVSAVILFFVISLLFKIVIHAFDIIAMLPVIGGLNRIAGAAIGIAIALVIIWIAFLIITIIYTTQAGKELFLMIQENPFLTFLYEHNYILKLVTELR